MANTSTSILNHAPSPRALELTAWLREYSASRLDLQLADERRRFADATDILGDIENFAAPLADFLPAVHDEEWRRDELVAGL